jgi:beta-glucosidase
MKKIIIILLSIALFNIVLAAENPCTVKINAHQAVTPVPRTTPDWWMPRHQTILERIKEGNVDVLMIGDSIIQGWENVGKLTWDKYYANRNVVNMGIGGDQTQHVIWRLQNGELNNINPKLTVLLIGTNNSNGTNQYTSEQIADGVKAIVCILRNKLPDMKILILAIFPKGDYEQCLDLKNDASFNSQWQKNDEASEIFSKLADNRNIYYLNINKIFLNKDGLISRDIMPDLLHPNEKGYQLWAEAMEPMIVKLMGENKKN